MKIHSLNLLISYQRFFIEETKKDLKKICKKKNYHFLFYFIDNNNYIEITKKIGLELYTSSFFYDKKVIFIDNISFLFHKKNINLNFLLDFFKKPNENIIIYLNEEKNNFPLEIKKKIYPYFFITKKYKFSFFYLYDYIKKSFEKEGFLIKKEIISLLINKTNNNLFLLREEINKIKLYHLPNKNVTDIKIIEKLVFTLEEKQLFLFIKTIMDNSKTIESFNLFEYLINQKESPFFIIYQILDKLEKMIIIKHLVNEKKKNNEIADLLKYSLEQIFFIIQEIQLLSIEKIKNLFLIFFELYYKMKKGIINPINGFKQILMKTLFNL